MVSTTVSTATSTASTLHPDSVDDACNESDPLNYIVIFKNPFLNSTENCFREAKIASASLSLTMD